MWIGFYLLCFILGLTFFGYGITRDYTMKKEDRIAIFTIAFVLFVICIWGSFGIDFYYAEYSGAWQTLTDTKQELVLVGVNILFGTITLLMAIGTALEKVGENIIQRQ